MEGIKATVGFIGAGMTGTALACQLWQQGYAIVAVNSRSASSANRLASVVENCTVYATAQEVADRARAVFITTPDDVIAAIAANLTWRKGQAVIHCSGVHSIDILEPARMYGASICCLHPLQTFASLQQAIDNVSGSTFALEGDEPALTIAGDMASAMAGNIIELKAGDKVLYHAAAVTLSNYLVTLMKMAADFWQSFGIPQEEAIKSLLPLLKGTVNNIERIGIPGCLTGPIARGDVGTIQKHLDALEKEHPAALDTYRILGLKTLSIALAKGRISLETAAEIQTLLEGQKKAKYTLPEEFWAELDFDFPRSHSAAPIVAAEKPGSAQ